MHTLRTIKNLLAVGVLLSALSLPVFSQQPKESPQPDQNQRDRMATTLTGCLSKDASGSFVITDSSGLKTTVSGTADLEKHANNRKLSLTGTAKTDASGKPILEVSKLTHISDTCTGQ